MRDDLGGRPVWNGSAWVTPQIPRKKNLGWKILGAVVGLLVVLGVIGTLSDDDGTSSVVFTVTETATQTRQPFVAPSTSGTTVTTTPTTATTTPTTTTPPPPVEAVPNPNLPNPSLPNPNLPNPDVPTAELPAPPADVGAYYSNCAEARAAGAAPIRAGEPGYRSELDRNGDGVACE